MRRDKENAARFHGKCVKTNKTWHVFTEITPGQAKRPAFSRKMRQDKENAARFGGNRIGMSKTPAKPRTNWSENYKKKQYILNGV